jgi:hypothetical protein
MPWGLPLDCRPTYPASGSASALGHPGRSIVAATRPIRVSALRFGHAESLSTVDRLRQRRNSSLPRRTDLHLLNSARDTKARTIREHDTLSRASELGCTPCRVSFYTFTIVAPSFPMKKDENFRALKPRSRGRLEARELLSAEVAEGKLCLGCQIEVVEGSTGRAIIVPFSATVQLESAIVVKPEVGSGETAVPWDAARDR